MSKKIDSVVVTKMKQLREKGNSLSEISQVLKIAKSTVSRYLEGIKVLPKYQKILENKRKSSIKIKQEKLEYALKEAKRLVTTLSKKEKLLFLSALYWAEGSKKDFGLSNTDPNLIKVYVESLRDLFNVSDDRFRISIRIYEDLDKEKCLQFWSGIVKIPKEKFVSVNILPGKKKGKLPYGMCRVRISKGEELLKRIQAIYYTVSQY